MINLAYFPFFIDIKDKLCVVVGGGKVAIRKITTLLQYGVNIKVISSELDEKILAFENNNLLEIVRRDYSECDLDGAFMVIGATNKRSVNMAISKDANKRGILSNISDSKDESSFVFPSMVKREEIVIGISSSSCYPALSRHIRKKVEEAVPESYSQVITELKEYRLKILDMDINPELRKEYLNKKMEEKIDELINREHIENEKND